VAANKKTTKPSGALPSTAAEAAAAASGKSLPAPAYVECSQCGAAVLDAERHRRWHDELARWIGRAARGGSKRFNPPT
jgi:hypothetical protein